MSDKLRAAAQALVDRWDTPLWKDAQHTGKYIDALRAALAEPEVQSTHSAECYKWHHGCAIARIEAALKEKNHEPR